MFELSAPDKDGVTLQAHLEGLLLRARTSEKRSEIEAQLHVPPLPKAVEYIWFAFIRLANRRQSTGFGPARISWMELEAFQRLTGQWFSPWEIELIEALDDLSLLERNK